MKGVHRARAPLSAHAPHLFCACFIVKNAVGNAALLCRQQHRTCAFRAVLARRRSACSDRASKMGLTDKRMSRLPVRRALQTLHLRTARSHRRASRHWLLVLSVA
jgi:hypothetical protein